MKIYGKLLEAKKQIGKVSKNAKNPHFKNTYADINALIEAVEPILLECGLVLLQPIESGKVITKVIDIDTGEAIESTMELPTLSNPQQMGSAITYYRRYTLQSLLSLQAEDDDGNKASQPQPKVKPTLSTQQFEKAIERMINGEIELYDKLKESFVFTSAQEIEFKEVLDVKN
jgi:hypothetical protein